jgi:glycosyltransferase involved in cell wall biosynthesis
MTLLDALHSEGAENVAVNIAVELKRSQEFEPIVCLTRWGGVLERVLKENGVDYFVLGRRRAYEIHKFAGLRKIVKQRDVRLIHAHKVGGSFWGCLAGRFLRVPVVAHLHAHHAHADRAHKQGTGTVWASRLIGSYSTRIISISEYERQRLIDEERIPQDKIFTIYNGVKLDRYRTDRNAELKKKLGIDAGAPVAGILAAFRSQKNHELFLRAAKEVTRRIDNVAFLLIGEGPLRRKMTEMAGELGIDDRCFFTGYRDDVPDVLSVIDVGVLSSHWEGMPIAALEYMASARPVVSTDVSGLSEVVREGETGFLTPPDDAGALAERIARVIEDGALAKRMGAEGLTLAREHFSQDTMTKRIEQLYHDVLGTSHRAVGPVVK